MESNFDFDTKENEFKELKDFIDSIKDKGGILIQILHKAQNIFGYLPLEVQKFISDETNIPMSEIYGVVTFYTQFSINPKGKHIIGVCLGTACYVKGSQDVLDKIVEETNTKVGQTTEDGIFTIEATRCLGCCGLAPVMTIDEDVYGKIDPNNIPKILEKYRVIGDSE